jgi:hypothetical protein
MPAIKHYNNAVSNNLFNAGSSDAFSNVMKRYTKFNLIAVGVENHLPFVAQFLYLFILTGGSKSFFARKHPSKKKYRFGATVGDTAKYVTYLEQHQTSKLLTKFYGKLTRRQLSPEYTSARIDLKYTKIIV